MATYRSNNPRRFGTCYASHNPLVSQVVATGQTAIVRIGRRRQMAREDAARSRQLVEEYLKSLERPAPKPRRAKAAPATRPVEPAPAQLTMAMVIEATRDELATIAQSQAAQQIARNAANQELKAREHARRYWAAFITLALDD